MSQNDVTFEPKAVCDYFREICQVAHCSTRPGKCGNEDPVRKLVIDLVEDFNKQHPGKIKIVHWDETATDPGQRCIVLRREADKGMENKETVVLQGHMDMVCVPDCDIFPIFWDEYQENKIKGYHMKDGQRIETTLGADDGIGLSTALAIITDTEATYGPIECLFTVQEETNMGGAGNFDPSWLTGRKLINLDSETDNIITYGSAGGSGVTYQWEPTIVDMPENHTAAQICIEKLSGGHSGVDIDLGRANAVKLATQVLIRLREVNHIDVNIAEFKTDNDKSNAIPSQVAVTVTLLGSSFELFKTQCEEMLGDFQQFYKDTDPDFTCSVDGIKYGGKVMDTVSSHKLLSQLAILPFGPLDMLTSPSDIVETSSNLAVVIAGANDSKVTVICSNRSSSDQSLDALENLHISIARMLGGKMVIELDQLGTEEVLKDDYRIEKNGGIIISDRYPGWMPNPNSMLLKIAETVYNEVYQGDYQAQVIHAGLECGWIVKKYDDKMDCIAIGPSIHDPHTNKETLDIDTVPTFYECVVKILNKIWA